MYSEKIILRMKELPRITGIFCAMIYRLRNTSSFPKPIRLSSNSIGWLYDEIYEWINEKKKERF